MSTSMVLWITLAVCVRLGSCEVHYKKIGESVKMNCVAGKDITWKLNNVMVIQTSVKTGRSIRGKSDLGQRVRVQKTGLEIPSLKNEDNGTYTCIPDTSDRTNEHMLYIMSAFAEPSLVLYSSDTTLRCDVNYKPDAKYMWSGPNGEIHNEKTVNLKSLSPREAGKWTCHISDEKGTSLMELTVDITVVGPLKTENLSIETGSNGVLPCSLPSKEHPRLQKVQWSRGSITNPPVITAARTDDHVQWILNGTKVFSFQDTSFSTRFDLLVTKVNPSHAGTYFCTLTFDNNKDLSGKAFLNVGENINGNVNPKADKSHKNFWHKSVLGMEMWVWVAVGMAFLFLISLLVITLLVYRRNKRMKMKMRRMKSVNEPLTPRKFCQCNRPVSLPPVGKRGRPAPLSHQYEHLNN